MDMKELEKQIMVDLKNCGVNEFTGSVFGHTMGSAIIKDILPKEMLVDGVPADTNIGARHAAIAAIALNEMVTHLAYTTNGPVMPPVFGEVKGMVNGFLFINGKAASQNGMRYSDQNGHVAVIYPKDSSITMIDGTQESKSRDGLGMLAVMAALASPRYLREKATALARLVADTDGKDYADLVSLAYMVKVIMSQDMDFIGLDSDARKLRSRGREAGEFYTLTFGGKKYLEYSLDGPGEELPLEKVYSAKDEKKKETKKTNPYGLSDGDYRTWQDAVAGKYRIDSYFLGDISGECPVPPLSFLDSYVPTPHFFRGLRYMTFHMNAVKDNMLLGNEGVAASADHVVNMTFTGMPGSGKSVLAKALAATLGLPFGIAKNSPDTDSDEFEGKTRIVDGKPSFVETDFVRIFTNGGILVNEECNLTPQGILMGALGQAVEAPYVLKVNGYEKRERHPMCIIINTCNVGEAGTKVTSAPFMSRFPVTYELQMPPRETAYAIMGKKSGADEGTCRTVMSFYDGIVAYLKSDGVAMDDAVSRLTLRHCIAAAQLVAMGETMQEAVNETLVGALCQVSYELAEDVRKNYVEVRA